jgi:hypothetical protein
VSNYGAPLATIAAEIIRPALHALGIWSQARECIVLGTGAHESHYLYAVQIGGGPALGWWQCEPFTHDDIWTNYLNFRPALAQPLNRLRNGEISSKALLRYPLYAAALCGVHYQRKQQGGLLPPQDDAQLQAALWKTAYNTRLGRGTAQQALPHFQAAIEATS